MSYEWSVAFGIVYAIAMALGALGIWVIASAPLENTPDRPDWLLASAFVAFMSSLGVFLGVMGARPRPVAASFVVGVGAALPALRYALVDVSDHGDVEILGFAFVIGAAGLLAVILSRRVGRRSTPEPQL